MYCDSSKSELPTRLKTTIDSIDTPRPNAYYKSLHTGENNIDKATIIVISSAIKNNNPEILSAKKKQLPIYKRGDMLAHIVSLTKNIFLEFGTCNNVKTSKQISK